MDIYRSYTSFGLLILDSLILSSTIQKPDTAKR